MQSETIVSSSRVAREIYSSALFCLLIVFSFFAQGNVYVFENPAEGKHQAAVKNVLFSDRGSGAKITGPVIIPA